MKPKSPETKDKLLKKKKHVLNIYTAAMRVESIEFISKMGSYTPSDPFACSKIYSLFQKL